ncbi:sensor histidine kinase [Planococcus beigongshangi]|uniref:sensor histidine kinase n=1 Tax=Planococcus beigongshangi TaxID=2782536 RepID=UPI001EEECFA5|nr:HAMP domain-containing sensor histidine kinase [Planococcus beigongshangi]
MNMYEMMTGMINNIFFIIFPIVLYQMLAAGSKRNFFVDYRVTMTILFSLSIILCMQFPYQFLTDDYIFDLRQVPMIVGALYGGPVISAVLFIVSAIYRILIGGDGMYIAILNQFVLAAGVPLLRPAYMRMQRSMKILAVFVISILSLIFNMVAGLLLFGDPIHDIIGIWLMLMLNQGALIALTALLIEHIIRQEMLLNTLMKHEKLESVSHFAASVSHELRNPIQSIKGFIQLMQTYDYSRDKQLDFHRIILKEIEAAESLIDDYLIYAKPVYGELERMPVNEETCGVMKLLGPYANSRNVEFFCDKADPEIFIRGDRQKYRQALVNIIRNGIDAMPDGGELHVRIIPQPAKVIIEIEDQGIGMTKEEVERLGEPYFSNKIKGTGLGLMVTYSVIHQMKGTIIVNSEKEVGTVFRLVLPRIT